MSSHRLWRAPGVLVIELREGRPITSTFDSVLPTEGYHDYAIVDAAQGRVTQELVTWTCSLGYDFWAGIHAVVDDRLEEITIVEGDGGDSIETTRKTRVAGLQPVSDRASRELAEAALARHAAEGDARRAQAERLGVARVAAIPGANDDLGGGSDIATAQARLRERIARYSDNLSADMLRALVALAVRCRAEPTARPALWALARACRWQCCDGAEYGHVPLPTTAIDVRGDPFLERLADLHEAIRSHAQVQEDADANATAFAMRQAAAAVHDAAALLAEAVRRR